MFACMFALLWIELMQAADEEGCAPVFAAARFLDLED